MPIRFEVGSFILLVLTAGGCLRARTPTRDLRLTYRYPHYMTKEEVAHPSASGRLAPNALSFSSGERRGVMIKSVMSVTRLSQREVCVDLGLQAWARDPRAAIAQLEESARTYFAKVSFFDSTNRLVAARLVATSPIQRTGTRSHTEVTAVRRAPVGQGCGFGSEQAPHPE